MPNSVPSAGTLLLAAARYLEDELLPTLEGYHRFQARVTVNVLRIVERDGASIGQLLVAEGLAHEWRGRRESWC